jgi:disulfide bond formation protein DsbB
MNQIKLHRWGNTFGLMVICIILSIALIDQFYRSDLPCPLCLLQRISFVAVGLCLAMNLKLTISTTHYGLMIISALIGFAIALRQFFLHLTPNDPGYGHLFWGINFFTWSMIAFSTVIALTGIALLLNRGFNHHQASLSWGTHALIILFLILILVNGISTFIECGFSVCPDNPVRYFFSW